MPDDDHDRAAGRRPQPSALRAWRYLWASPTTLVGLAAAALTLASRGRGERRGGVLEMSGGFADWLLSSRLLRADAMALGHVVLGRSPSALDNCRTHELAHVRQAERWGPFFLPAYLLASVRAHLTGGHYYRDNPFEIEAVAVAAATRHSESNKLDAGANG